MNKNSKTYRSLKDHKNTENTKTKQKMFDDMGIVRRHYRNITMAACTEMPASNATHRCILAEIAGNSNDNLNRRSKQAK